MPLTFYDIYCRRYALLQMPRNNITQNATKKNFICVRLEKKRIEKPKSTQFQMQSI